MGFDRNASKEDLENLKRLKELKSKFEAKANSKGELVANKSAKTEEVGKSQLTKRISKSH